MRTMQRGISLVEVLLGLSIGVMLFTSVATAIQAGSQATTANQDFFSATQSGRLGISYMLSSIRKSDPDRDTSLAQTDPRTEVAYDPSGAFTIFNTIYQTDGSSKRIALEYSWDKNDPEGRVLLRRTEGSNTTESVLVRNVSSFAVGIQSRKEASTGHWYYHNYQINMTVTVGNQSLSFSESSLARRAMEVH